MKENGVKDVARSLLDILDVNMSDLPGALKKMSWMRKEYIARLDDLNTDYIFNKGALELTIKTLEGVIEMINTEMADDVPTEPHQR